MNERENTEGSPRIDRAHLASRSATTPLPQAVVVQELRLGPRSTAVEEEVSLEADVPFAVAVVMFMSGLQLVVKFVAELQSKLVIWRYGLFE